MKRVLFGVNNSAYMLRKKGDKQLETKAHHQDAKMKVDAQLVLGLILNLGFKVINFVLSTQLLRLLLPEQSGLSYYYTMFLEAVYLFVHEIVSNISLRGGVNAPASDENDDHLRGREKNADSRNEEDKKEALTLSVESAQKMLNLAGLSVPLALVVMTMLEVGQGAVGLQMLPSLWRVAHESAAKPRLTETVAPGQNEGGLYQGSLISSHLLSLLPELTVWISVLILALAEPCLLLVSVVSPLYAGIVACFFAISIRYLTLIGLIRYYKIPSRWGARMIFATGQLAYALTHMGYYGLLCSDRPIARRWMGGSATIARLRQEALNTDRQRMKKTLWRMIPYPWCCISYRGVIASYRAHFQLLCIFFRESLLRLVFADVESVALSAMGTEAMFGIFQFVTNLGKIFMRLLFHVWEGPCFVRWSCLLAAGRVDDAVELLFLMLRLIFYIGVMLLLVGPSMVELFIATFYTRQWVTPEIVQALQWYMYAPLLYGVKGLLEGFLRATASPAKLLRMQRTLTVNSIAYLALCYGLIYLACMPREKQGNGGTDADSKLYIVGYLIIASMANTLYQIFYAVRFLTQEEGDLFHRNARNDAPDFHLSYQHDAATGAPQCVGVKNSAVHEKRTEYFSFDFTTLRKACVGDGMVAYIALLFLFSRVMNYSVIRMICIGLFYVAGILLFDMKIRLLTQSIASSITSKLFRMRAI